MIMKYQSIQESVFYGRELGNSNETFFECSAKDTYIIVSHSSTEEHQRINQLSLQITKSEDVEKLLDHVNWTMLIYSCDQPSCYNSTGLEHDFQNICYNSSCCFTNSLDDVLQSSSSCGSRSCTDSVNSQSTAQWYGLLIFGLLCLLGNVFVVCDKIISLLKKQNIEEEVQIYYTLVLNLASADLLMGVYLTGIAFEIKHKAEIAVYFSEYVRCNVLGIINTVSSQISITTIFIISFYRLVSVVWPYKRQHFKKIVTLIVFTWLLWLIIAVLPLIPIDSLKTAFTYGLVKDRQFSRDSIIEFSNLISRIQNNILPSFANVPEVKAIFEAVSKFRTPSVIKKFSVALGWIDFENENWNLVGFYDSKYLCFSEFIINDVYYYKHDNFEITLVCYNLIVGVSVLIAYLVITIQLNESDGCACCKWFSCYFFRSSWSNKVTKFFSRTNDVRKAENRKVFKRISIIILSDVVCWVSIGAASIAIWPLYGQRSAEERIAISTPFQISILILVFLNSLFNPYIYSSYLWSRWLKKIKK